jgi:predicted DCC family thiol-disulfide oxidoreductase YuxK
MEFTGSSFLVYDGECPFCANYVELLRLRESFPGLQLLDARSQRDHPVVRSIIARGIRIDDGMALITGDSIYHGADSIHALALHGGHHSAVARLSRIVFRSRARSNAIYPMLRAGRNLVLRLLGRSKLGF